MLLTSDNSAQIIEKNVPRRYQEAIQPIKVDGMTWFKSFYLNGAVGRGKTHNAWAFYIWLIKAVAKDIKPGKPKTMPDLKIVNVPQLMASFQKMQIIERREVIDGLIDVYMLILDDLGGEYITDYNEQFIYDIVEGRYISEKYTGFISNIELGEDLPYDIRIISRIRGIVGSNGGTMVGEDWRLKND